MFAAFVVGYGLGEQAQLGDGNHKRTFQSLEERGYTQDVGYGRYAITEAGRRALQKDLS